jgi:hypothetical protein
VQVNTHVTAYYYLVILKRRHGGAVVRELRRVVDVACDTRTRSRQELMRLSQRVGPLRQGCHKPVAQCVDRTTERARDRNTMGARLAQPHCKFIGRSVKGSA